MTAFRSSALAYARRILADRTTPIDRRSVRKLAKRVVELSKKKGVGDRAQRRELRAALARIKILTARCQIAEADIAYLKDELRMRDKVIRKLSGKAG